MRRIRLDPAQRRDQLLALGMEVFGRGGLDRISIEEIAKTAGISKGLLFHYFANKRGYQLEIVRRASAELLAATEPDPDLAPMSRLRDSIERYVDYVSERREAYISQLRGPASAEPEFVAVFEENRKQTVARVLDSLPTLDGFDFDRTEVEVAVRGWIAFVEETTISWLRGQQISREQLVELNFRALPAVALPPQVAGLLLAPES